MKPLTSTLLILAATPFLVVAEERLTLKHPAVRLELVEAARAQRIDIHENIDGLSHDEYWKKTYDAIFDFADSNSDDVITIEELPRVPSVRSIRLSLGSAFTPPVAALISLAEITGTESQSCTRQQLRDYYLRHQAGSVQVGYGKLTHTSQLTRAVVEALDDDQDGRLSRVEIQRAESVLKKFDTNDDELIGVGELVPNAVYPGTAATNPLLPGTQVELSSSVQSVPALRSLPLVTSTGIKEKSPHSVVTVFWQITISDQAQALPLLIVGETRSEGWSVAGPLADRFLQLQQDIAQAEDHPAEDSTEQNSRSRRSSRAWLIPLADRDRDGTISPEEIERWLALQHQIIHGHVLISIYYSGGLLELLDQNHDAGLSIRELRTAWQVLEIAGCTVESQLDLSRVPGVTFFIASQGYPNSFRQVTPIRIDWFQQMDRNTDGDVSRREFIGSLEAFGRMDIDQDGLISLTEAAAISQP